MQPFEPTKTNAMLLDLIKQMRSPVRSHARAATERFYREMYRRLRSSPISYRYPSLPHQVMEELIQESMIAIYNGLKAFRGESLISTWAIGIFRNKVIDYLRSVGTMAPGLDDEELEAVAFEQSSGRDDVLEAVSGRQALSAADLCLNRLGEKMLPSIIIKQWSLGDSIHELARVHDMPVRTLQDRFRAAYKKMIDCMRAHGWSTSQG